MQGGCCNVHTECWPHVVCQGKILNVTLRTLEHLYVHAVAAVWCYMLTAFILTLLLQIKGAQGVYTNLSLKANLQNWVCLDK